MLKIQIAGFAVLLMVALSVYGASESFTKLSTVAKKYEDLLNSIQELREKYDRNEDNNKDWDKKWKDILQKMDNTEGKFTELLEIVQIIKTEIPDTKKEPSEIKEIIENINNRDVELAKSKIMNISEGRIYRVVRQVYDMRESNFDLIMSLGDSVNYPQNFYIYKALRMEMVLNGHQDPIKQLQLLKGFLKIDSDVKKDQVRNIEASLKEIIKDKATFALTFNEQSLEVYHLSKELFDHKKDLFKTLIKEVINNVYNKVENVKILDFIELFNGTEKDVAVKTFYNIMEEHKDIAFKERTALALLKMSKLLKKPDKIEVHSLFKEKLKDSLLKKNFEEGKNICLITYNFDFHLFFDLYKEFVNYFYGINKNYILDFTGGLNNTEMVMNGLLYIYEQINEKDNFLVNDNNVEFLIKFDNLMQNYEKAIKEVNDTLKKSFCDVFKKMPDIKDHLATAVKTVLMDSNSTQEIPNRINNYDKSYFDEIMYKVIKSLYGKEDYDKILSYIHSMKNIGSQVISYQSLYRTMGENNDLVIKTKTLPMILKFKDLFDNLEIDDMDVTLKKHYEELKNKLPNVKKIIKDRLKTYMLNQRDNEVLNLTDLISNHNTNLVKDILYELVKDFYGNVQLKWILKNIFKLKYIEEYIIGCSVILEHIEGNGDLKFKESTAQDLIELHSSIEKIVKMPNYKIINNNFKKQIEYLKKRIPEVWDIMRQKIVHDLLYYNDLNEIREIANHIYKHSQQKFQNIVKDVIENTYNKINIKKILDFLESLKYIGMHILGYVTVFKHIEMNKHMNNETIFHLAYKMKTLMKSNNYEKVDKNYKDQLDFVRLRIPVSTRNIVFSEKVCIKNHVRQEFMFAENDHYQFDKQRRNWFTLVTKGINIKSYFKFERYGEHFLIKNTYFDEYVYTSLRYFNMDYTRRMIFSAIDKTFGNESLWAIEPHGDQVYIRSAKYNEYLYSPADSYLRDEARRRIFTFVPQTKEDSFQWKIVDCSDF